MALLLHTALLAADGSVAGQVTDPQGNLVAGATLRLSGAGAAQPGVATGAGSPVRVSRIDAGDLHTLSASAGNFEPATETFPLGRSESLTARPFGDTKGSCAEATYSTPTPRAYECPFVIISLDGHALRSGLRLRLIRQLRLR
jgi:hypothetical protein